MHRMAKKMPCTASRAHNNADDELESDGGGAAARIKPHCDKVTAICAVIVTAAVSVVTVVCAGAVPTSLPFSCC